MEFTFDGEGDGGRQVVIQQSHERMCNVALTGAVEKNYRDMRACVRDILLAERGRKKWPVS